MGLILIFSTLGKATTRLAVTLTFSRPVALNARDLLVLTSSPLYPMQTSPGLVPCGDAAGIVEEVGKESAWKVGDRVILHPNSWLSGRDERDFDIANCFGGGTVAGTLTEYMVVGDERLIQVPEHLSLEEASALPTAGGTGNLRLIS